MQIILEVPDDLAQQLAGDMETLSRIALEALALESIRSDKLSISQARRLLGISSRFEMDEFLKSHGYTLPITGGDTPIGSKGRNPVVVCPECPRQAA